MKRVGSSHSLGAMMSICPISDDNQIYSREFQSILDGLDEEEGVEESGYVAEKKRRLNVDQVKALEKDFEVENKLDPGRKLKLAQQLGLRPRQVAVWFQNRRARWKTKQLEKDYGLLKNRYETLKLNYDSLQHDNQVLLKQIEEVKAKLNGKNNVSVKEEVNVTKTANRTLEQSEAPVEVKYESLKNNSKGSNGAILFLDLKDGSSDSDSSAVLNEDNNNGSNYVGGSSSGILQSQHVWMSPTTASSLNFNSSSSSSSMKCFQPQQFVKMEEQNFFSADEACKFFSDEEAPSLHWYCPEHWN
ncbi:homeobox-leucine zipper protein ATHB-6 [Gossypium raimondii]|uniref:Homeobox-leucine zipper protein n=1 Tax=Gossypium raimondii TaxID=29730 RepID=A0A0D2PE17_GOSRA|nr:homeobox-leucine zipper protein ATHB-6 [Gossypium raimondii]KJB44117.1 hypothetical protein B456_007G235200 [Gossypium raimondii]